LVKIVYYCLFIILISIFYNSVYADNSSLKIEPSNINLEFSNDRLEKIPPYGLIVFSNTNFTNIQGYVTNLHSDEGKKWIPKTSLTLVPNTFSLNKTNFSLVDINFNLPNSLGNYSGNITFISNNERKDIPIHINIYDNTSYIRLIQIILVVLGVIAAFFQSFLLSGM